jgi:uncharacterized protein
MKQLLFIRWWQVFDTKEAYHETLKAFDIQQKKQKWRRERLFHSVDGYYECICPNMPNQQSAEYEAWKIWFEKYLTLLNDEELVLIGWSLWAIFLLKYLSEEGFSKKIDQLHIVSAAYTNEWMETHSERLDTFSYDVERIWSIQDLCESIFLYHGKNDDLIPFRQGEYIAQKLPQATFEVFETRGHFRPYPAFPELLENIWIYHR